MERITNQVLAEKVEAAVKAETLATLQVLKHLQEVERRELHLSLGYSSLWDYATKNLGYSEPAAHRRISTARSIAKYPEIESLFLERSVNLTTVSLISSILNERNHQEVAAAITGKSKAEVKAFIAGLRPVSKVRETVKEVVLSPERVATRQCLLSPASPLSLPMIEASIDGALSPDHRASSASVLSPDGSADQSPLLSPAPTKVFKAQVVFSESAMQKVNAAKDLLSHRTESLGDVIEVLAEYFLQRESSVRKTKAPTNYTFSGSRYIPKAMRVEVRKRDGNRCTFVGPDGRRCTCTSHLEFDHVIPCAHGGKTKVSNLRLLCSNHNKHGAKVVLGRGIVEGRVEAKRAAKR